MDGKKQNFVYNIEILIEDFDHQQALIQLLKKMSSLNLVDYKIVSGIELGDKIQIQKQKATSTQFIPITTPPVNTTSKKLTPISQVSAGFAQFHELIIKNKLIRLIVNRGLGVKLSIPCRVLNVDEQENLLNVYHVDEKQVYTFSLIEIEDIIVS